MFEIIKPDTNIDFMGRRKLFFSLSLGLILVSILSLAIFGLNLGIDFKGGTRLIVAFQPDADVDRGRIGDIIQGYVGERTGRGGTQVEVQDFDTGAEEGKEYRRFVIYTELTSLISREGRQKILDTLKSRLPEGTSVEAVEEGEDKYYINFAAKGPIAGHTEELRTIFRELGYEHVAIDSEEGRRLETEYYKTLNLSEMDRQTGAAAGPSPFEKSLEEFTKEKEQKLAEMQDRQFTVQVEELKADVTGLLAREFGDTFVTVESSTSVSASVGRDLLNNGLIAILYALIGILIYIALRFDFRYSPGAVLALIHDAVITIGVFSLAQLKFTQPIIAALLTIIGYSLNDTIVVYDRIRENVGKFRGKRLDAVINSSINETLSRTVLTSGTTLLVVLAIVFLGGGLIRDFAFALLIGVLVGTYSSIFVASPVVLYLDTYFKRRAQTAKDREPAAAATNP